MKFISNKSVIALAALAASGATFAQAVVAPSVTLYGSIEMALEANSDGTANRTSLQNFSSNFGIKGDRQFNSDLSGIFQLETGVAPDDTANSKTLTNRNSFVGLKSATLGSLIIGTYDMPLKELKGTTKIMLGEGEAMETIIHGRGTSQSVGSAILGQVHTRKTNLLLYTSPKFSNMVAKFGYSPDKVSPAATATVPAYSQPMVGASLEYNDGFWNAGLAFQSQDNVIKPTLLTSGQALQATKATLGAQMGDWKAGLAFSSIDNNAGRKTSNWMISSAYSIGAIVLKANYGSASESASGAADGITMAGAEVDYALDKATVLFVGYSKITNSKNAKAYYTQSDVFPQPALGKSPSALNLGIQYKF